MSWVVDLDKVRSVERALEDVLSDSENAKRLEVYFGPESKYSGGAFESLGIEAHGANEFGCHDLLSLNLLDVPLRGRLVRALLTEEEIREEVRLLLDDIRDEDLWEASSESLDRANELWARLRNWAVPRGGGLGPTRLSKLLARKRPHLIPITDSVVTRVIPVPAGVGRWRAYRTIMGNREDYRERLSELRERVPKARDVALLRVLDVIVWMRGREGAHAQGSFGYH